MQGLWGLLTFGFVDHVDFNGEVLGVDLVLAGRVIVELLEFEFLAVDGCCAFDEDFDVGAEIGSPPV
jgi:hypothetical protein